MMLSVIPMENNKKITPKYSKRSEGIKMPHLKLCNSEFISENNIGTEKI